MLQTESIYKQRNKINELFDGLGLEHIQKSSRYLADATVQTYEQLSAVADGITALYPGQKVYYRGQEQQFVPGPGIARGNRGKTKRSEYVSNFVDKEYEFISAFRRYCIDNNLEYKYDDYLHFMTICQHYGIPTRLLDVTANKDVAVFFATEQQKLETGCVYIFIQGNYAEDELLQMFLLDQAKLLHEQKAVSFSEMIDLFAVEHSLSQADKEKFIDSIRNHYNRRAMLHIDVPKECTDIRVKNQEGSFMLFGNALWTLPAYELRLREYGVEPKEDMFIANAMHREKMWGVIKLRIPHECKRPMLQRVMQNGISRAYIYPSFESHANSFLKSYEFKNGL